MCDYTLLRLLYYRFALVSSWWYNSITMNEKRLTLRLPADLHRRLVEMAKRKERSLNNLIVRLLRQATEAQEKEQKDD